MRGGKSFPIGIRRSRASPIRRLMEHTTGSKISPSGSPKALCQIGLLADMRVGPTGLNSPAGFDSGPLAVLLEQADERLSVEQEVGGSKPPSCTSFHKLPLRLSAAQARCPTSGRQTPLLASCPPYFPSPQSGRCKIQQQMTGAETFGAPTSGWHGHC